MVPIIYIGTTQYQTNQILRNKKIYRLQSDTVLLDMKQKIMDTVGKPIQKILVLNLSSSQFLRLRFLDNVKKNIDKKNQILVMCAAGGRSIITAELLANEGYDTLNISDGFSGNGRDPGWKNLIVYYR